MPTRSRRLPRDTNQLAKWIVDKATGNAQEEPVTERVKNPAAVALGKLGGTKGGKARAQKLTPEERTDIARTAASARWKKS